MNVLRTQVPLVVPPAGVGNSAPRTSVGRAASRNRWWESLKRVEQPEGHHRGEGSLETWKEVGKLCWEGEREEERKQDDIEE